MPLGRGLGALLGGSPLPEPETSSPPEESVRPTVTSTPPVPDRKPNVLPIDSVQPCSFQPRKDFDPKSLKELADSIRSQGVVQPLVVRPAGDRYELIAGERRWRAAQLAGLQEVPAVVREADDREVVELTLVENLQRENLNPIEEALGMQQLAEQFRLKQDQIAEKVGKSRAVVANALRLLRLPPEVQDNLKKRELSVGHAKVILGLTNPAQQSALARRIVKEGLSVRKTEELVAKTLEKNSDDLRPEPAPPPDPNIVRLEEKIRQRLGTRIQLRYQEGKGALTLKFFSDEDLERIVQLLGIEPD